MLYDFWAPKEVGARQHEMDCLALMFDGRGLVDEAYKDGSGQGGGEPVPIAEL